MGPLGFTEIVFILVLALLLFGPRRLPELGRMLGRGLAEFRRASTDLRASIEDEVRTLERQVSPETDDSSSHTVAPPKEPPKPPSGS
ncbi:MAG: twin-arginine translocase TatA/TatE family subunit [Terriglobia bacterium]